MSTMIAAASAAQFAVANDYFNQGYTFNNSNYGPGTRPYLIPHSNFISTMQVEKGWVRVTGNSANLNGNQINLVFQPTVVNNSITWTCYVSSAFFQYAPAACRNTGCAVYTWGPWTSIDVGTTWMYNGNPATVATVWSNNCTASPWFFGCMCKNAVNTNLVQFQLVSTVISNVNNGWGWTYLVTKFDCQQRRMVLTSIGSCGSCPGGSTCQDMFTPLT
ncbi:MAG TPA: pilin [Gammaproteobacteria bacterium]|nr:pilin [Gammaproteobacteria bacterium]